MDVTTSITDTRTDDLDARIDLVIYELDQPVVGLDPLGLTVHCSAPVERQIALAA